VIVNPGGKDGQSVAAYDKLSGKRVWSGGNRISSYGSLRAETLLGEGIILVPLGEGLAGHSLADGSELWFFPWMSGPKVNAAQPLVVADNSLLFGCGYGIGTVRLDLARDGTNWTVTQRWHSNRFRPKFNDFVLHEGHVYGLDDGTLTCLDIESGKVKWKSGRYGYGQLLLVDETLLILSETGRVVLVPASPSRPEETASFQALSSEYFTWNHPVLVRGKLLVRNAHEAACFELE
jgi:outer membrane protein assembly factor BamB